MTVKNCDTCGRWVIGDIGDCAQGEQQVTMSRTVCKYYITDPLLELMKAGKGVVIKTNPKGRIVATINGFEGEGFSVRAALNALRKELK